MTDLDGRYVVTFRSWRRQWQVQDQSWNPPKDIGRPHDTEAAAQQAAHRLNNPPRPQRPRQTTLFDNQEASA